LAFERLPARRIVQQRHAVAGTELEQRLLQLELLGDAGVDERLHRFLPEPLQLRQLESAREPLDAGDTEVVEGPRLSVERVHSGIAEDFLHLGGRATLVIVIAEHRALHHLDLRQLLGEPACLFHRAVVCQVAGEQEHFGFLVHSREGDGDVAARVRPAMEITDCGDAHRYVIRWTRRTSQWRSPKRFSRWSQSSCRPLQRSKWWISAPSNLSRSWMKAFCQIISSAGTISAWSPSTVPGAARLRHCSSTVAMPFPEEKIRSTNQGPEYALASQISSVISVRYPARASTSSARWTWSLRRNRSRSLVSRQMPVCVFRAYAPPTKGSNPCSWRRRSASRCASCSACPAALCCSGAICTRARWGWREARANRLATDIERSCASKPVTVRAKHGAARPTSGRDGQANAAPPCGPGRAHDPASTGAPAISADTTGSSRCSCHPARCVRWPSRTCCRVL